MRVWVGISRDDLVALGRDGVIAPTSGYAVTPGWASAMDEYELEVLEDEVRSLCDTSVVLVCELKAQALPGDSAQVRITEPLTRRSLQAVFIRPANEDDYSWFGPTELPAALDFHG